MDRQPSPFDDEIQACYTRIEEGEPNIGSPEYQRLMQRVGMLEADRETYLRREASK